MILYRQITAPYERRRMRRNKTGTRTFLPRGYIPLDRLDVRGLFSRLLEITPIWHCPDCEQEVRAELIGKGNNAFLRCPECRQIILRPNCFQIVLIKKRLREHLRDTFKPQFSQDAD